MLKSTSSTALRKDFQCPPPLKGIRARLCAATHNIAMPNDFAESLPDYYLTPKYQNVLVEALKVVDLVARNLTPAITPPPTYKRYIAATIVGSVMMKI